MGEGREWGKGIFSCIMQFYEVLGNVNLLVGHLDNFENLGIGSPANTTFSVDKITSEPPEVPLLVVPHQLDKVGLGAQRSFRHPSCCRLLQEWHHHMGHSAIVEP